MKVMITGGAGFLGRRLALKLLERGTLKGPDELDKPLDAIVLVDVVPAEPFSDPRVRSVTGDIGDGELLRSVIDADTCSIFHLAAIVSGQAEADFDLGMRINLDASRLLLDVCRAQSAIGRGSCSPARLPCMAASFLTTVLDSTAINPQSSYGMQKAVGELLLNDYSRKGFVDGRVLRLPTISVRPGKPNKAASSFASGIIREPLNGEEAVCPVSADTRLWLLSPRKAVECLIAGHELPPEALGPSRIVNLPGISVRVGEMVAALERIGGKRVIDRIRWERGPGVSSASSGAGPAPGIQLVRARSALAVTKMPNRLSAPTSRMRRPPLGLHSRS